MQRKNISLEYGPENSPKTQSRGSDEMDFNDVFGGPPRRFSMQEMRLRYSFGESAEPEEEQAASPWSGLKEKPVFGEESFGRRTHQVDDFYDDIFRGDESYSSSPRRSDQRDRDGVFGSNPGSRIMSPSRPLPPKAEPFGTSLPTQFSLPAKMTKAMEPPTFASRNHSQFKTDGSNGGLNSPHTPNSFSRFWNQPFKIQDEVRNEAYSVKHPSPLSREASCDDLLSHQKDLNLENSSKDTKTNDGNGDQFHFSIYKWAGKGVPMLMPLVFGYNSRPKLSKDDKGVISSNGRMETNCPEIKLSTVTDQGHIKVKQNDKRNEEKKMPKHVEDELHDLFDSKSKSVAKDNVAFDGLEQKLKTDEVWSLNDVDRKEKIEKEFYLNIKNPPKSKGKPLKVFLTDEVTQPEKKESKIKTPKGSSHNKHPGKNSKNNEEKEVDPTKEDFGKSSKNRVKGKVKEFVQIFNVETNSNPKSDFRARSQSYRWNTTSINKKDNGDQSLNQKEKEKILHDVDKKKFDVSSLKVEEITNKDRPEEYPRKKSSSYEDLRFCVEQKNEFFSSESFNLNSKIPMENADDLFEDNFQVEELSEDHETVTQKQEGSEDIKALDAKIRQWSVGKKGNIRSLLSTLQYVLWPGSGWTPVPLVDLIEANAVKRAYQKALLRLHPDKLQQKGADASHKYTAEKVFDLLQEAWDHFNTLTPL